MNRIISVLKWVVPIVALIAAGTYLVRYGSDQESKFLKGYRLYDAATSEYDAATAAYKDGNLEKAAEYLQNAYALYIQSAFALENREAKAVAFYEAATVGWATGWAMPIADYRTLVGLYQESLRNKPGFYESAFDLELLYWLKAKAPSEVPSPKQQEGQGEPQDEQGPQPGSQQGRGGGPSNGDI